jgi:hypothetical protein
MASATCSINAPASVTAGQNFTISWSGGVTLNRRNFDGTETTIATDPAGFGTAQVFATNVLGNHTYKLYDGNNVVQCSVGVVHDYTFTSPGCIKVIPVLGSSNAAGRGLGPFTDPQQLATTDARIFQVGRLGGSDNKIVPIGYWHNGVMWDGLHSWDTKEHDQDFSHALTFARHYIRYYAPPDCVVVIVPGAKGGTYLGNATNPEKDWRNLSSAGLFVDAVHRVQSVLALPGNNEILTTLVQVGENNYWQYLGGTPAFTPAEFQAMLTGMLAKWRELLPQTPDYPFIVGGFAPTWVSSYDTLIRTQFQSAAYAAAAASAPSKAINMVGLTSNSATDIAHLNAASQVLFGYREYRAWESVMGYALRQKLGAK